MSDTITRSKRPRWFEPWEWCVIHDSYRGIRSQRRCREAWGDPFTVGQCQFGEHREVSDE